MDTSWNIFEATLWLVVFLIAPAAFVLWVRHRQRRAARTPEIEAEYAAAGFDVSMSWIDGVPRVKGAHNGTTFMLAIYLGMDTTPTKTVLSVPGVRGVKFAIWREASRDLSGRDYVEEMFPDARARDAVRALFLLGFDGVESRNTRLSATRMFRGVFLPLPTLRTAVDQLAILQAAHGPRTPGANEAAVKSERKSRQSEAPAR